MTIIHSDNAATGAILEKIVNLVKRHGGYIDPALSMRIAAGTFSIHSSLPAAVTQPVIFVPDELLPSADDFAFTRRGTDIEAGPAQAGVTPLHQQAMALMLELFNSAGKLAQFEQLSPRNQLRRAPGLWQHLCDSGQLDKPTDMKQPDIHDIAVSDFFASRYGQSTGGTGAQRTNLLMPVIDCLNHHDAAFTFSSTARREGLTGLTVQNCLPVPGSDECFISYGKNDAVKNYLQYAFLNTSADYLRSVRTTVKVPGLGDIIVNAHTPTTQVPQVPPGFEDMRPYLPFGTLHQPGQLTISHLLIMAGPRLATLRRALVFVLAVLNGGEAGAAQLAEWVPLAEAQLLAGNRQYFQQLGDLTRKELATDHISGGAADSIVAVAQHQLQVIDDYETQIAAAGN